jgi:spermidine/putrescine transport system substrate-binding protein
LRTVLILVVLLAVAGCTGAQSPTATPPATVAPTEEIEPTEDVGTVDATDEGTDATVEPEAEATGEEDDSTAEPEGEPTGEPETTDATASPEADATAVMDASATPEADAGDTEDAQSAGATEEPDDSADAEEEEAVATTTPAANVDGVAIDTEWTCPEGLEGQTLSLFNWATYIGDNTVSDFENLCDVNVEYTVYDSDESLIARLRQGNPGFDLAFPTDYAVAIMIRDGLAGEIDLENIPNVANIDERYLNPYFDPGNGHSVPYVWGTTGIGYDIDRTGEEITTWQQVFEYDGRVAWVDSSRAMLGAALSVLGLDPNTTDPADIEAAKDYLIEHSSNVVAFAQDDGDALLAQGEVDIAIEYGGDVFQQIAECECDNLRYAVPTDGGILDLTSVVLLADAPNPELAQVFMDYLLDPNVHAHIVNTIYYPSPNRVAVEQGLIDEDFLNNPAGNPPVEALGGMFYVMDVGEEAEQLYNDAWDEVKILSGT